MHRLSPVALSRSVKRAYITRERLLKPLLGGALTVLCGLMLWYGRIGDPWINASYDHIFLFSQRQIANPVVLVMLDTDTYDSYRVARGEFPRRLHTQLLQTLSADGAALVVFDILFDLPKDAAEDEALAAAIRQHGNVVLMARQAETEDPKLDGTRPVLPHALFLEAARTNFGVAWLDPDPGADDVARWHWPFGETPWFPDLPTVVAKIAGASVADLPNDRWLRYYSRERPYPALSFHLAMRQPTNFFRGKIVFVGNKPATPYPDVEEDEFRTPYTRWSGRAVGGVEVLVTAFLNLVNGDWLRRASGAVEICLLLVTGILSFWALHHRRPLQSLGLAAALSLGVILCGVSLSHFTNYWFPYLIVAGGQIPFALAWNTAWNIVWKRPGKRATIVVAEADKPVEAEVPDFELIEPHFGEGAYGKVWLARNAVGQWQAFKAVYLEKFGNHHAPYDREFNGIKKYKPISDKHPGLLRVDFVSRKKRQGFFYYVMELGDSRVPGWEQNPKLYRPRDLAHAHRDAPGRRLPLPECARIGVALADALSFLHRQNLTHRDIKPSNIFFVNGVPKLGDVGLVTDLKPLEAEHTFVGTPGFMPPPPEPPGTAQADVFALGMVLYVISTGRDPAFFPELSATLVENTEHAQFMDWNRIIVKACHPDRAQRYANAAELHGDLVKFVNARNVDAGKP